MKNIGIVSFIRHKIARLVLWALDNEKILTTDNCVSVGVDIHLRGRSWAVINIDGEKTHVLKFVDLNKDSARDILGFLRQFEKVSCINIDADPFTSKIIHEHML